MRLRSCISNLGQEIPGKFTLDVEVPLDDIRDWKIEWEVVHVRAAAGQTQSVGGESILEQKRRIGLVARERGAGDEWWVVRKPAYDSEVLVAAVKHAEAAAYNGFTGSLVGQPHARREVIIVGAGEGTRQSTTASIGYRDELQIARAAVQHEVRLPVELFHK